MNRLIGFIMILLLMLGCAKSVLAQESIVFAHQQSQSAFLISLIDSIITSRIYECDLYFCGNKKPKVIKAEAILFNTTLPDTLILDFQDEWVGISNPHLEYIDVSTQEATVYVTSRGKQPLVCMATGFSKDGRIIIDADTTSTLILSGLQLSSKVGSTIYFKQKHKAEIVLADGTKNTLNDAKKYTTSDTTDTSNACLYAKGSLTFSGTGSLDVNGSYRHAIASSRNITIFNGHVNIPNTKKDGIHCDKYKQTGGTVRLNLTQTATKGIKTKEEFELKGGRIEGEATGDLKIEDCETSYCTFIKSDSLFTMSGGDIQLKHTGKGGRCISVDRNFNMRGGTMSLECHGDGGSYLTAANDSNYYTPKCITADDSVFIQGGRITCLSTGLGGKGIVAGRFLSLGNEAESDKVEPFIRIETRGECIINDEDEDQRSGCPKGIKADSTLIIYGGDIAVTTSGMGGEGVESNGEMYIHGGTLECNTFDDGINVARSIEISGGLVYCNSTNNDGIDSNGSITISGGIVASINQQKPNESFDAEKGQIYLTGGTVFGIGSGPVDVAEARSPCYTTSYDTSEEWMFGRGLLLTEGKYVCVQRGNDAIIALRNENKAFRSFLTIMSPHFADGEPLMISEGDCPTNPQQSFFGLRLVIGGVANNPSPVTDEIFQTIKTTIQ